LKAAGITGTETSLNTAITDSGIDSLGLQLLQEGNPADVNARRAGLKQSLITLLLDVAGVRILNFTVQDINMQSVDRLEAGLEVRVGYDYAAHFSCTPANLGGTSAPVWEHLRSYLFDAKVAYDDTVNETTAIDATFSYDYYINNTIGHWEDWEASLALEFSPASATNGALLNTTESEKLEVLKPTEKGLSVETWVKPSVDLNSPGTILYYKKGVQHYALGLQKIDTVSYKCVATLGDKKYTSKNTFAFKNPAGNEQWKHLAFTHKKYWGYQLGNGNTINCGNDSSLHFGNEFTVEALVKINTAGTLLEKAGEYCLKVDSNNKVVFNWRGTNCLEEWIKMKVTPTSNQQSDTENYKQTDGAWYQKSRPGSLGSLNQFYKVTVIRSGKKPRTAPTTAEYPITGNDNSGDKWYENKSSDEMIKGMAEKQDQME
ncbi:MAG: hypothetical protein KDD04_09080, partial [Sinomicrobium sp.]|nr:hypothetical protein [Sinomicrobium sp.]